MINSVTVFKANKTVIIRYENGCRKTYMTLSDKAMDFILREDVKAFENEESILYRVA